MSDWQPMQVRVRWETGWRGFLYLFNQISTVGPGSTGSVSWTLLGTEPHKKPMVLFKDSNGKFLASFAKTKTSYNTLSKKFFFLLSKITWSFSGLQKKLPTKETHHTIVVNAAVPLFPASPLVPLPGLSSPFSAIICFLLFSHAQWSWPLSIFIQPEPVHVQEHYLTSALPLLWMLLWSRRPLISFVSPAASHLSETSFVAPPMIQLSVIMIMLW